MGAVISRIASGLDILLTLTSWAVNLAYVLAVSMIGLALSWGIIGFIKETTF